MREVWEALADSTRRKILKLLKKRDMSAGEIYDYFDITKPSLSHHLSVLKKAKLVDCQKQGQNVIYSLRITALQEVTSYVKYLKNREE